MWVNCEKIAKWLIKSCTVRMCCKCYSPSLTLKRKYLPFGNDDRPSNDRASPGTSLQRMASVHKAQTSDHFGPLPNGDGVAGVDVVLVSIGEALCCWWSPQIAPFFLIARAQSDTGRQYRCRQCWVTLGLCTVPCNKRYYTLKNYKRSPRHLIGQIAGQMIKK